MSRSSSKSPRRYRSPDGRLRPYLDGKRWVAPAVVTLPDGSTKKVRGTGRTQDIALERRNALIARTLAEASAPQQVELRTLTGWCQHWLDKIKGNALRNKTRVSYQHAIDAWITPRMGALALHDVTLERVEALHAEMQSRGLSRTNWVTVRTVLNQALTEAVKRGHLASQPMLYAPGGGPKQRSMEFLDEVQARQVVAHCNTAGKRARWLLALSLGLRQGEALALTWGDLNLDTAQPSVSIRKTLQRVSGKGLVLGPPKTRKSLRDLLLPEAVADALREHRRHQRELAMGLGQPWTPDRPVFATARGTFQDSANDRKQWKSLLARARVPYVKPHAARHSTATLMLASGVELSTVADALGHASVAITADVYGHLPREVVGDATEALAARLTG